MKLVVGLGNPGKKYEATRHNAGFWWVEGLARAAGATLRHEARFHGEVARIGTPAGDVWLLKPATYMNESGRAVGALADFYKIAAADILVAHDELDLPPGGIKLKFGGSASGNGVRSIISRLGTRDFWRLRIGIGHPRELAASEQEVVDYVLHAPRAEEQRAIEESLARADDAWPLIAAGDMQAAMLRLHTKPGSGPAPKS
ncbi:MAG: aminoacyl-tRNA hydrolase [Burkholderiales bacterium]|jgi:PTH1 family peptidyl-tRNA hydrolase|nr:aminoacyl-tRNA hydrolase [Burkholderiales bacterium]